MNTSYAPTTIEVFRPSVGTEERAAITDVLASGWLGSGPRVSEFERRFAQFIGVQHVIALTSATEALFQVMRWISDHHSKSEVILPANAFIGAANAARESGLVVRLCDVDVHTLNPNPSHIEAAMTGETMAVIVQHFGGTPTDLSTIAEWCQKHGIVLIEDCACAVASEVNERAAGAWGDFGVWSFDAMKIITTGDGGMLYCRDEHTAEDIRRATYLGQDVTSGQSKQEARWWEFNVEGPGRRARMNDIAAAIGLEQMKKLTRLVARRQEIWEQYQRRLAGLAWLTCPPEPPLGVESSYYCYWIQCERRDELAQYLRAHGIYTTYRYWPVHYAYGWQADVPNTEWIAAHTLLLPLHAELSEADVDYICDMFYVYDA